MAVSSKLHSLHWIVVAFALSASALPKAGLLDEFITEDLSRLPSESSAKGILNENLLDEDLGYSMVERQIKPLLISYYALGDSYPAGVGAGNLLPIPADRPDLRRCLRRDGSYDYQLRNQLGLTDTFHIHACSGDQIDAVNNAQVNDIESTAGVVTVQVGGNDAFFFDTVRYCAYGWPWSGGDCQTALKNSANTLASPEFRNKMDGLLRHIRRQAPTAQIIFVGYAAFFNVDVDDHWYSTACHTAKDTRIKINQLVDQINNVVSGVINGINADPDPRVAGNMLFMNTQRAFDNHRYCDSGAHWFQAYPHWWETWTPTVTGLFHPTIDGHTAIKNLLADIVI